MCGARKITNKAMEEGEEREGGEKNTGKDGRRDSLCCLD